MSTIKLFKKTSKFLLQGKEVSLKKEVQNSQNYFFEKTTKNDNTKLYLLNLVEIKLEITKSVNNFKKELK